MKKSLSILLAIALVFSMFSSMAFAADGGSIADKLVNAGIIKGTGSGDLMEDQQWKREDVTVIISRLLDAEEEAKNTPKNHTFADVDNSFYDGFITWAKENGYFQGHSDVRFGMNEEITTQQFAAVMLRALGYDDVEWDDVPAKAVEVGLVPAGTDFSKAATRGEYFVILDTTLQTENVDGEVLGEKLGLPGYAADEGDLEAATEVVSAEVVGAKKVEVKFNGDATGASVTLKKGAVIWQLDSTALSADKKSVVITATDKLSAGSYTVTVSGIEGLKENSATFVATDEVVGKIELKGETIFIQPATKMNIVVQNQYGETFEGFNIVNDLHWTISDARIQKGTVSEGFSSIPAVTMNQADIDANAFLVGNTVTVTLTASNGVSGSQTYTLAAAQVPSTVSLSQPEPENNAERLMAGGSGVIKVNVKDQYGNDLKSFAEVVGIEAKDAPAEPKNTDKIQIISNTTSDLISLEWFNNSFLGLGDEVALRVNVKNALTQDRTVVLTAVTQTGNTSSVTFTIHAAPTIDSVNVAPSSEVVAEGDAEVYLDLEAYDQFGTKLNADEIVANVGNIEIWPNRPFYDTATIVATGEHKGKLRLTNISGGEGSRVLTVVSRTSGKTSSITIDVQAARYAAKAEFVNAGPTKLLVGAESTVTLKLIDQYGKEFTAADANHVVEIKSESAALFGPNDITVDVVHDTYKLNKDIVPIAGQTIVIKVTAKNALADDQKGPSVANLVVKIISSDENKKETRSTIRQAYSVVDGTAKTGTQLTYSLGEIPLLWTGGATLADYQHNLQVVAKDANGDAVQMPAGNHLETIYISNTDILSNVGDSVYGVGKGTALITVAIKGADGSISVDQQIVTVSNDAPAAKELTAYEVVTTDKIKEADLYKLIGLGIKDQYGNTNYLKNNDYIDFFIVGNNTFGTDNDTGKYDFTVSGEYSVTAMTKNGLNVVTKVIVR